MSTALDSGPPERIIPTTCSSHCGGSCLLRLHVKGGKVTRLETDDGPEPQLRACPRGRAYRQRAYAPDRLLYPLKRVGERGEGRFERIAWGEAIDIVAGQLLRVRDAYGPSSIVHVRMAGDSCTVHNGNRLARPLALLGGFTEIWGVASFGGGMYAQQITYGTHFTSNTRDDLPNSRFILMWGWNPAVTVAGVTTAHCLAKAREAGARIVAIDPRFTDSAAALADEWVPIRPGTDGAMAAAIAYVMVRDGLQDQKFLDRYTVGFDRFLDYVLGRSDGIAKTPQWAEAISGVPVATIERLARAYATTRPAALLSGIAPGRTAYGEQFHRLTITLAALTGNVGIHGGDSGGRAWEALPPFGGYPYPIRTGRDSGNPVYQGIPAPKGSPFGYLPGKVHFCDLPDFVERGRAGGYPADCRLMAVTNCNWVNSFPNSNRIVRALRAKSLEFVFIQEQFLTSTARYCDVVLPTNTFFERNDVVTGVGLPFYGSMTQAINPVGESKSHLEIAQLLAERLGITELAGKSDERWVEELVEAAGVADYEGFRQRGTYQLPLRDPYVAFKKQIEEPERNPFPTPSGKIEIYSQTLAERKVPNLPAVPTYIPSWEGRDDPIAARYPLQMISSHYPGRANAQFANLPWLKELWPQVLWMNPADAERRGIADGNAVRVFNGRGVVVVPARVTERIMPGVVDLPHGAWYDPGADGVDRGGCPNVLTRDTYSPGGAFPFNTCLVEVEKEQVVSG